MNLTDIRHGTPEWHAIRAKTITGTDVSAILGNAKWKTPLDIWSRIVLETKREELKSAFLDWGNAMEPVAAAKYEEQQGIAIERTDRFAIHESMPYFGCSPDGFLEDPFLEGTGLAEIKCPSFHVRDEYADGVFPIYYVNQLEANLCVTGLKWGVLIALLAPMSPTDDLIVTKVVQLSDERRAEIESTVAAWHKRHIVNEEQPDAIFRDEEYLRKLHPDDEPRTVLLTPELLQAAEEREALLAEVKAKKEAADNIKARLMQNMKSAAWASNEDGSVAFSFRTAKNGVRPLKSIKKLPKAAPLPQAS